jgi:hypothetical protein
MCDASVEYSCEGYCRSVVGADGDCGAGPWQFPSQAQCMQQCTGYRGAAVDSLFGDSLQCRVFYLNLAEQSLFPNKQSLYCPNTGASGGRLCADDPALGPERRGGCEVYCALMERFCTAEQGAQQFPTPGECLQYCRSLPSSGSESESSSASATRSAGGKLAHLAPFALGHAGLGLAAAGAQGAEKGAKGSLQCHLKFAAVAARSTAPQVRGESERGAPSLL